MSVSGDSSLLLWLMSAVVALLAGHVFVAWVRRAQGHTGFKQAIGPAVLAGAALGAGITSSMVLALSAEALSFSLGYRWMALPALVLGPMLICMPLAFWLSRMQNWWTLLACAVLLAAMAVALQFGWITAAGMRPGIRWNFALLGAAAGIQLIGFGAALWLAYSDTSGDGQRKTLWRAGGAVLVALSVVAGEEVVISAAGLLSQVGAIYQRQATATWMCLVAGAIVPIVLALLSLDIWLRNRAERPRRRSASSSQMPDASLNTSPRRKRRRKYRTL
jgi:hypothetical protein